MWASPKNNAWQPVPGLNNARFMPLIRSAPAAGCNVYLVEYPELFLLVDMGVDPERLAEVADTVNNADPSRAKPLLLILTHCHIDHIAAAPALEGLRPRQFAVAGHEACRLALAGRDQALTVSYLFRCIPPPIDVGVTLFGNEPFPSSLVINLHCPGNTILTLSPPEPADVPSTGPHVRNIMVADRVIATAYATPGHSPDSISLLVGRIIFCGDLPFVGNPAVAGIPGWSRSELLTSLDRMAELLGTDDKVMVCAGHGPISNRDAALAQFAAAKRQTLKVKGIATLDADRAAFLKGYARALLYEANSTFAIILGRLWIVAEHLELLDEKERSQKIRESADLDALCDLVEKFDRSAEREERFGEPETRLPMVAGEVLAKIDRMLGNGLIAGIIDAARLRRARNLILDFRNALQGISFRELLRPENPDQLVHCLLEELRSKPYEDDDLMAATDDHENFVEELMRRMAYRPLFSGVSFCPVIQDELPMVAVEREHLLDTLVGLCELLVASGGNQIVIDVAAIGDEVRLTLSTMPGAGPDLVSDRKVEFYTATLYLYGAKFAVHREEGQLATVIHLPVAVLFETPVI
jgi:glyoxylase-like metal-dependent hydrolase (beta-lactamase superfamily II)